MKTRSISIPTKLWAEALACARKNEQALSGIIRRLLRLWLEGKIDIQEGQNNDRGVE